MNCPSTCLENRALFLRIPGLPGDDRPPALAALVLEEIHSPALVQQLPRALPGVLRRLWDVVQVEGHGT